VGTQIQAGRPGPRAVDHTAPTGNDVEWNVFFGQTEMGKHFRRSRYENGSDMVGRLMAVDDSRHGPEPGQNQYQYPFQNPNLPIEERVSNIISLLTPEEKVDVLGANYYLRKNPPPSLGRLGIRGYNQAEGLHGLARGKSGSLMRFRPRRSFSPSDSEETWDPEILEKPRL